MILAEALKKRLLELCRVGRWYVWVERWEQLAVPIDCIYTLLFIPLSSKDADRMFLIVPSAVAFA
jgi:hypothetical protein